MLTLYCLHAENSDFSHKSRGNCIVSGKDEKVIDLKSPFSVLLKYIEFIMHQGRYFKY
jgi:hypothetical protein